MNRARAVIAAAACLWLGACDGMTAETEDSTGSGGSSVGTGGSSAGTGGRPAGTGGIPIQSECTTSADCIVGHEGCCAPCEPVRADDLGAYSASWYAARPECEVACAPCQEVEELDRAEQYYIAHCILGQCVLIDIRADYAECTTGEDCILRQGSGCCSGCGDSGFIAVSSLEFLDDACADDVGCPECDPIVPQGLSAQCNLETERCQVVQEEP